MWNKMKSHKALILAACLCCAGKIYGQSTSPYQIPSPNAVSISRYGDVPVSYYTGTANISIPLFSMVQRDVTLDVSLAYDTSGHLVNNLPGCVGHGWSLNAGGVITRVTNGPNDEYSYNGAFGYFSDTSHTLINHWNYPSGRKNTNHETQADTIIHLSETHDLEPDIFIFNFMGKQGRFLLGNDGQWKVMSDENLTVLYDIHDEASKISPFISDFPHSAIGQLTTQPKTIKGFTIIDENGNRYVFGGEEEGDTEAIEYNIDMSRCSDTDSTDALDSWHASSWYLKKVIDRHGNMLYRFWYERGFFVAQIAHCFSYYEIEWRNTPDSNEKFPYSMTLNSPVYLSRILMRDSTDIKFTYRPGKDMAGYPDDQYSSVSDFLNMANPKIEHAVKSPTRNFRYFWYLQDTARFSNYMYRKDSLQNYPLRATCQNFLERIEVRRHKSNVNRPFVKSSYGFTYITNPRVFLQQIEIFGGNKSAGKYTLTYAGYNQLPADYASTKFDHWGYYNGREHSAPSVVRSGFYIQRSPDSLKTVYGMLEKIGYPTGGHTEFEYEPNKYGRYITAGRDSVVEESGLAGGVRIRAITDYENDQTSSKSCRRTFEYSLPDGSSSGQLYMRPTYIWGGYSYIGNAYKRWDIFGMFPVDTAKVHATIASSHSIIPLSNSFGPHVGYSRVVERWEDNIHVEHAFCNFSDAMDELPLFAFTTFDKLTPYDKFTRLGHRHGKPLSVSLYNENDELLQKTEYTYRTDDKSQVVYSYHSSGDAAVYRSPFSLELYKAGCGTVNCIYYPRYDVITKKDSTRYATSDGRNVWVCEETTYNRNDMIIPTGGNRTANIRITTSEVIKRGCDSIKTYYGYSLTDTAFTNHFLIPLVNKTRYVNNSFAGGERTEYGWYGNRLLPKYELARTLSMEEDTVCHYINYTDSQLPERIRDKNGLVTLIVWDTCERPVAQIANPPASLSFNPGSHSSTGVVTLDGGESVFSDLPISSTMATYNDKGLINSITSGNGSTLHYVYDKLGRLVSIKDSNSKTIKTFEYKYDTGLLVPTDEIIIHDPIINF